MSESDDEGAATFAESLSGMDASQVVMKLDALGSGPCQLADAIGDRISELNMVIEVYKREEAVWSAKRQQMDAAVKLLKSHMLSVLESAEVDSAEGQRWEAVKCKSPDRVVLDVDEDKLPHELTRVKRMPDKVLIKAALKEHFAEMDGVAHLECNSYVRMNGRKQP